MGSTAMGAGWRGVALGALVALATGGVAVHEASGATRDPALTVIVSPADRSIAPRHGTLTVRLRMASGATVSKVVLNGRVLAARPGPAADGVRRLVLRASDGLRGGENVLAISTRRGRGGAIDFDQSIFWFASRDPSLLVFGAPRAGADLPSQQVTAAIRTRVPVQRMRAWLNGRPVTGRFAAPRPGGVRRATLSAVQGLSQGHNILRVEVVRGNRFVRIVRRFDVDGSRPLASPGADVSVEAGQPVELDGSGSLPSTGGRASPANARRALAHAWTIARRPRGSSPGLTGAGTATPTLTTDLPGSYVLRHVVSDGSGSSAPVTLTVSAFPAIAVPVDTLMTTSGGGPGVRIGATVYPNPGTTAPQVHALRLDRSTLELLGQQGFPSTAAGVAGLVDLVDSAKDDLLVLSVPPGASLVASPRLSALGTLLDSSAISQRRSTGVTGPFSLITIPGSGAAAHESIAPTGSGGGALVGNLVLDINDNYAFAFPSYPTFDTQAAPASGAAPNTIGIGSATYPAPAASSGAAGGFQVLTLNPFSLAPIGNATFSTNGPDAVAQIDAMTAVLTTARTDGLLAVVASFGAPAPAVSTGALATAWNALGVAMEGLGGTRDVVLRLSGGETYSLVGRPPGGSLEASSRVTPAQPSGRQTGFLSQDSESLWRPAIGSPAADLNYELAKIVYQAPTAWPLSTSPGDIAANAYIAGKLDLIGSDVRANYRNQNDDFGGDLQIELGKLTYPGGDPGFTRREFAALQTQLGTEFGWVSSVRLYITNLKSPFQESATPTYATLEQVSSNIVAALSPPPKTNVKKTVFEVVEQIIVGVSRLDEEIQPLGALGAMFGVAAALSTTPSGVPTTAVTATTGQLGADVEDAIEVQLEGFDAIGDVIVSDYGKLQAVATSATGDAAWAWDATTTDQAAAAIAAGSTQSFWAALMPTAYTAWTLPESPCIPGQTGCAPYTSARQLKCSTFLNVAVFRPFKTEPGTGQIRLAQQLATTATPAGPIGTPLGPILAWGAGTWTTKSVKTKPLEIPPSTLTKPLFEPLNVDDIDSVTAGLYGPWFWSRNFTPVAVPSYGQRQATSCPQAGQVG